MPEREAPPAVDFRHSTVVAFFGAFGDNCDPYRKHDALQSLEGCTGGSNQTSPRGAQHR